MAKVRERYVLLVEREAGTETREEFVVDSGDGEINVYREVADLLSPVGTIAPTQSDDALEAQRDGGLGIGVDSAAQGLRWLLGAVYFKVLRRYELKANADPRNPFDNNVYSVSDGVFAKEA